MYNADYERQMLDYFKNGDSDTAGFPTFAGFAERMGVTLGEMKEWRRENQAFARTWDECRERQKARLIVGGLTKRYDPSFCKFLLGEIRPEETDGAFTVTVEVIE